MLNVIFTLDYEIHGNGDGNPYDLMVEPTYRMMDLFDQYGAKLTIMADVAEILKFREYKEEFGKDDYHYQDIVEQLQETVRRGHDVQLHLHPSYFNARFKDGRWEQDWREYNFAGLPLPRLNQIVGIGKAWLEELLKPIEPSYQCIAFRAANWSVNPARNVVRALQANGIRIDTSVFKYGRRAGIVNFDYSSAHSNLAPWPVDEADICRYDPSGQVMEFPIYCERRWIGAFLTLNRVHRALSGSRHRISQARQDDNSSDPRHSASGRNFIGKISSIAGRNAWKADFNQCTGRQLAAAAERASRNHDKEAREHLPFVLIGHSKLFTKLNERSLRPFLRFASEQPDRFRFGTFQGCLPKEWESATQVCLNTPREVSH